MAEKKTEAKNKELAEAKSPESYPAADAGPAPDMETSAITKNIKVQLASSLPDETDDVGLWAVIRDRTDAIGFGPYSKFINRLFCLAGDEGEATCTGMAGRETFTTDSYGSPSLEERKEDLLERRPSIYGVDAYQLLKLATQAFLSFEAGIVIKGEREDNTGIYDSKYSDPKRMKEKLGRYLVQLENGHSTLPYLEWIAETLISSNSSENKLPFCDTLLRNRFTCPSMLELIWSYWQEEGMLVQSLNAIAHRFQNRRLSEKDPLINLELDPIRPLNNLLWGFIQDARSNMSTDLNQRSHEYLHHYGISLYGRAVKSANPADKRSNFIPAFHTMMQRAVAFYKQDADTTIKADGFPLMQAIKDVHLILAEGAHNQFGDLPWTTRAEMLMMQWLLARPELSEFLRGRYMVPYKEAWMGTVDAMKQAQGWTGDTVTHFRDLATFGEQIVLSVRWGNWGDVNNDDNAKNWANYWKPEIQSYIHSYNSLTGIDLSMGSTDTKQIQLRNMQPSVHLQRRLMEQQRTKGGRQRQPTASGNPPREKPGKQDEVMSLY